MALIDDVKVLCDRLAPLGWRDLLLHITDGKLDITKAGLKAELTKPLAVINRTHPGFEDFALDGDRGITAGSPARSLLYHALGSPLVLTDNVGVKLRGFPTLAELEFVENHVFGIEPPSIAELLTRTGESKLALAVFAFEYRPAKDTCSRRRAEMIFCRTGISRVGTAQPFYNEETRGFWPEDPSNPRSIRVTPCRYAPFLAAKVKGNPNRFVPMGPQQGDNTNDFWQPVHKIFPGPECLKDLDLEIDLTSRHVNEKIFRVHKSLGNGSPPNEPTFRFSEGIAEFSNNADFGSGLLIPVPSNRLIEPARHNDKLLTYKVPKDNNNSFAAYEPEQPAPLPEFRPLAFPEYVHARFKVENDSVFDLNTSEADILSTIRAGEYDALNFVDFTGDGEISVECPQLETADGILRQFRVAYSLVSAPDFFPSSGQRELTEWTNSNQVPASLRTQVWGVPPDPLNNERLPANLQMPNNKFDRREITITALGRLCDIDPPTGPQLSTKDVERASYLSDDSARVKAPGWSVSQDLKDIAGTPVGHLAAYGLGSPFPEDAKLCAALSTFWPAVAPDTARSMSPNPNRELRGTVAPLTDAEIGQTGSLPWDGVPGPKVVTRNGELFADCPSFFHVDYLHSALQNRFSIRLTSRVDAQEYEQRILGINFVYQALGGTFNVRITRNRFFILSFTKLSSDETVVQDAMDDSNTIVGPFVYHVDIFRLPPDPANPNELIGVPHPDDFRRRLIKIFDRNLFIVDPARRIILRKPDGLPTWTRDPI